MKAKFRRGRGKTVEDHVAALEKNFEYLERESEEHRQESNEAVKALRDEVKAMRVELENQQQAREREQKEFLRASVSLQWWGIGLFVSGVLASGAANVISCS
jgi:hypothetical protein